MLYEFRTYHAVPGKLPEVVGRFEDHTLRIFAKHGIRPEGFWTTYIGPNANTLFYILAWESLAERESVWHDFVTDPEWVAVRAESEKNGALIEWAQNTIMAPTAYSKLQ